MQNQLRNRFVFTASIILFAFTLVAFNVIRKETISFKSEDGLEVTADEYIISSKAPYIVLFHEQESSRGEFTTIARKLCKMDYNCLAVDLRNGGGDNWISNETVKRCRELKCPDGYLEVLKDMEAAIEYAYSRSGQPVILLGSSANGSLALKMTLDNENVRAAVALSPGEYFLPELNIQDTISALKKPLFISGSTEEMQYVEDIASGVNEDYVTLFKPEMGNGGRGSYSLSTKNENHSEYWLALLLFFKELV